jgi:hypothetical protein
MTQIKKIVTVGCSLSQGFFCEADKIYSKILSDRFGCLNINLSVPGSGWNDIESTTLSFIQNNKNILDETIFIIQNSTIDRSLNYNEIPLYKTDVWEKYNIDYVTMTNLSYLGSNNHNKFKYPKPLMDSHGVYQTSTERYNKNEIHFLPIKLKPYNEYKSNDFKKSEKWAKLKFFPIHKHYENPKFPWKLGKDLDVIPNLIQEQFQQLMFYWGKKMLSFHLLLKKLSINHIFVDGYTPFLSNNLEFENYYDTDEEFLYVQKFWNLKNDDDSVYSYDFKNIKSKWMFDLIDKKNKIDDVVLWSLFQFKDIPSDWNKDGVHAGYKGHKLISEVLEKNLIKKGFFT